MSSFTKEGGIIPALIGTAVVFSLFLAFMPGLKTAVVKAEEYEKVNKESVIDIVMIGNDQYAIRPFTYKDHSFIMIGWGYGQTAVHNPDCEKCKK